MRILLINNFFRNVGGVERVFFAERELLLSHGHEVIDFATAHPENVASPYAKFFPSSVDYQSGGDTFKKMGRLFYSYEVVRKLRALIRETKPDVAHIQGMFDLLGPSVVYALRAEKIPMVFTAHAYKLVCPSGRLFTRDEIDERCQVSLWNDVFHRAIHDSFLVSAAGALALFCNKKFGIFDSFDRIISPSNFLIHKHESFGWNPKKFIHIPNPIDVLGIASSFTDGRYMVFAGRLVAEKGLDVLLDACTRVPHIPVKIIGDGPLFEKLQQRIVLEKLSNVSLLGKMSREEVFDVLHDARAVLVPSVCYETDPYSVLEAQAMGKIVIASHTGGIPEQIAHGETGFLVERGNSEMLADMMANVWDMPSAARISIGKRARGFVDVVRSPELYYESLVSVLSAAKPRK